IPRAKPAELHGPHHAAYHVPLVMATCVMEWPAPLSPRICQSQEDAPQVVSQPFATPPGSLIQTYRPPAIHRFGFARSASKGAMKRAPASHGFGVHVKAKHDGEISRNEFDPGLPSETPP